jgi:mono/diheme cytochrome c family protein
MGSYVARIRTAGALVAALTLAVGLAAQAPEPQKPAPKIKRTTAVPLVSVEGKDNYDAYCAVCHGPAGKGDGPAAPAMKVAVPDLTTFAKRHGGKFNAVQVEQIIRGVGKTPTPAHGVEDMPIWGEVFRNEDRSMSTLRIGNLVKYVQSIQAPAGSM